MKISGNLNWTITREIVARTEFKSDILRTPVPTGAELHAAIENLEPYRNTTNRAQLVHTLSVEHPLNSDKSIELPQSVPVIKTGSWPISADFKLEYDGCGDLGLCVRRSSSHMLANAQVAKMSREFEQEIRMEMRQNDINTTAQFIKHFPQYADLECIVAAVAHEKELRAAAKLRKKDPPKLEPIEVNQTAIAKARLLGAKYVT